MTEAVERRAIAFIRTIGNRCMGCLRRTEENCRNCISRWANSILRDVDGEKRGSDAVDYSFAARVAMIVTALEKAGRPLASRQIDLHGLCSRQLKFWTLLRMTRMGRLRRTRGGNGEWLYELVAR